MSAISIYLSNEAAPPDNPNRRDFKVQRLCDPCWNNQHVHPRVSANGKRRGATIIDCNGGECECLCREFLAEQRRKIAEKPKKPQRVNTNQRALFEVA